METIKTPTPEAVRKLIDDAVETVSSWPLWKANPEVILAARRLSQQKDTQ